LITIGSDFSRESDTIEQVDQSHIPVTLTAGWTPERHVGVGVRFIRWDGWRWTCVYRNGTFIHQL